MMVVHLDRRAPYQGTARDEGPYGGSNGSGWRVITVRAEPRGRKITSLLLLLVLYVFLPNFLM
jgi:hypothetical protein